MVPHTESIGVASNIAHSVSYLSTDFCVVFFVYILCNNLDPDTTRNTNSW